MNSSIRPKLSADDDLEQLQEEFFASRQVSSASVKHVAPPVLGSSSKKKSIFAQRQQTKSQAAPKKHVEDENLSSMPDLEETISSQQDNESHTPVSKNMLDLSSLLGNILGDVKENQSDLVEPPSIRKGEIRSQQHAQGFPRPARRSVFKQSMTIQSMGIRKNEDVNIPDYERDNIDRIEKMSAEEIEEARKEIFSTLSSESVAMLMNRAREGKQHTGKEKQRTSKRDEESLIVNHRVDDRSNISDEQQPSNVDDLCCRLKFNYRGETLGSIVDSSSCQGLHNHSDDPDKAGYTLEELFYLTRSQMPSQRAMALNTMACIIQRARQDHADQIIGIYHQVDQGPMFYIQSALDDKHLTVLVSAVKALAAVILDEKEDSVDTILNVEQFNEFLGYASISNRSQDQDDGAKSLNQEFIQSLLNTSLLSRLRYLMLPNSELCQEDNASFERIVNILIKLARHGHDACKAIQDHQLLSSTLEWGVLKRDWPMTQHEEVDRYPSLSALQLLTVLARGSRDVASTIASQASCLLQYLVTSPDVACAPLQNHAYALQVETLKLFQLLLRYGYVVPGFSDLHESIMGWLRASIAEKDIYNDARGVTAIRLLESSLHAAAKPHSTTPKHAIEWNQAIAFVPVILAVLRTSGCGMIYDAAVGYFATYVGYFNRFPSEDGEVSIKHVWTTVIEDKTKLHRRGNANSVLRYLQLLRAFSLLKGTVFESINRVAQEHLKHTVDSVQSIYRDGILGRLAMWMWMSSINDRSERIKLWGSEKGYDSAELETTVKSVYGCALEAGLARKLVQLCILDRLDPELVKVLRPFYLAEMAPGDVIFDQGPVSVATLTSTENMPSTAANVTAWLFSPIDKEYHVKNHITQQQFGPAAVVAAVLEAASLLLEHVTIDHDVAIVSLMKIFLIGSCKDHTDMKSDHEIFWNHQVSYWIRYWLDKLCLIHIEPPFAETIDDAWRRSSTYTRQSFYQFYQSFVAQYASTSFGERNFARLLAYITIEANDVMDYRYLLWNDYCEVLSTIKVSRTELPNMDHQRDASPALVQAYLSAIMGNNLCKEEDGDAMYHFAGKELELSSTSSLPPNLSRSIEQVLSNK
ncbi:hypothetical protein LRAMOSA11152 [Lichtheimia ramosa]|uniref:RNA polymerase II-associated protein 1 C-terminal domain-containing protein n=1 Tax=Lichtheimia ramosa TaxID=688394 RepID=A0A077WSV7_9FUNG|nr:hypothetical protein LRAMOSA11152 [Lichtheimia ramosa]